MTRTSMSGFDGCVHQRLLQQPQLAWPKLRDLTRRGENADGVVIGNEHLQPTDTASHVPTWHFLRPVVGHGSALPRV
jgi:hypothetical protein